MMDELKSLLERHTVSGPRMDIIPGFHVLRADWPSAPMPTMLRPVLCVAAQGRKRLQLGDRVIDYDQGHYLLGSVDLPISGGVVEASRKRPYLGAALDIDPAELSQVVLEMGLARQDDAPVEAGLAACPLDAQMLEPIVRLLRLLDRPEEVAFFAPMIRRELYFRLLSGPNAGFLRQLALLNGRSSQIIQAIDTIRRTYAQTLRIEDLARSVGMSPTSFYRHFKAVTAMSPLQYQKLLRLQEARRQLLGRNTDIAGIGIAVGYESAAQFTREYSRLFGAPPKRDAERLRTRPDEAA